MLQSNNAIASVLTSIYNSNTQALTQSLTRLSSGKRVMSPSDDFGSYLLANNYNQDIAGYQRAQRDLQNAKGYSEYAISVGDNILEDLTRMKELKTLYDNAAGDSDLQNTYKAEYDAIVVRVDDQISDSSYDGVAVYTTNDLIEVDLDGDASGASLIVKSTAVAATTDISNIATVAGADMTTAIRNAQSYVAQMSSVSETIDRHIDLSNSIIASKESAITSIVNIDEMSEMTKATEYQIRQQASIAMMAQANMSHQSLLRLFS